MGALTIAITLFKIYVALNTPQLGRNLILAIQSPSFPPFNTFPASQRVTYRYYLGRMAILDDKLVSAATLMPCLYLPTNMHVSCVKSYLLEHESVLPSPTYTASGCLPPWVCWMLTIYHSVPMPVFASRL